MRNKSADHATHRTASSISRRTSLNSTSALGLTGCSYFQGSYSIFGQRNNIHHNIKFKEKIFCAKTNKIQGIITSSDNIFLSADSSAKCTYFSIATARISFCFSSDSLEFLRISYLLLNCSYSVGGLLVGSILNERSLMLSLMTFRNSLISKVLSKCE